MTKNKIKTPEIHVMIVAAGSSTRMKGDLPKPYIPVHGTPILRHVIDKFNKIGGIFSLSVVIHPDHRPLCDSALSGLSGIQIITGGASRKESVWKGLEYFSKVNDNDIIFIHDAARPLFSIEAVQSLITHLMEGKTKAASLASPVTDSLVRDDQTVERNGLWSLQTPQGFEFDALIKAHKQFHDCDDFTDDTAIMRAAGYAVALIPSPRSNIKLTTPDDLMMIEKLLSPPAPQNSYETRTASGFDVHAFDKDPSANTIRLGGIDIPHPRPLTGHSDADVALHAITDAVLGLMADGDIGTHFPPSDPQWKGADSAHFLDHALNLLNVKGGTLTFLDVTILCEEPKIGPQRTAMQTRLSALTHLPIERISVKATTTEQLGFTGRKEGIAVQALATARFPLQNG